MSTAPSSSSIDNPEMLAVLAARVGELLRARGQTVSVVES